MKKATSRKRFPRWGTRALIVAWLLGGLSLQSGLAQSIGQLDDLEQDRLIKVVLNSGENMEALRAVEPTILQVLQNWRSPAFVQQIREAEPEGSLLFLEACVRLGINSELVERWVMMMPESVGVEYVFVTSAGKGEECVDRLLNQAGEMNLLMDILLRQEYHEWVKDQIWEILAERMIASKKYSCEFLPGFQKHDTIPEACLNQAENLQGSFDGKVQLLGAYLHSYRMPERSAGAFRSLVLELMTTVGEMGDWIPLLQSVELTAEQAFVLAAARAASVNRNPDKTFSYLALNIGKMTDEEVLDRLTSQSENLSLLRMMANVRPEWIPAIGNMLLEELEREFTNRRLMLVGYFLLEHDSFRPAMGRFDAQWAFQFQNTVYSKNFLLQHAPLLSVRPELVWEVLKERLGKESRDSYILSDVRGNLEHIFKHGDAELISEMLEVLKRESRRNKEGSKLLRDAMEDGLARYPEKLGGVFQLQLKTFAEQTSGENSSELLERMYAVMLFEMPVAEYFETNKGEILQMLLKGERLEVLYPMLCMFSMNDRLRDQYGTEISQGILTAFRLPGLKASERFTLSVAGVLLGLEDERMDHEFLTYFLDPANGHRRPWKIYYLLDATYARFLPALLKACDTAESSDIALISAMMISPTHPEVEQRALYALFEGDDHALACQVVVHLDLFDRVPALSLYPEGRLEWLLHADTREKFHNMESFLQRYDQASLEKLLPMMLPKFPMYAKQRPLRSLGVLFEQSPANQRDASEILFQMMDSMEHDEQSFACDTLGSFSVLTDDNLRCIGDALHRFRNELNLNPRLLNAVAMAGQKAAFLEGDVARLTHEGRDLNYEEAYSCLASISENPALRSNSLSRLMGLFEKSFTTPNVSQSGYVRNIVAVQGQEERVISFLRQVIQEYLEPQPGREITKDAAKQALWGLTRQRGYDDSFDYYHHLLQDSVDNSRMESLIETLLWCLSHEYENRLPEIRNELEQISLHNRATYIYRKIHEEIKRQGSTQRMIR